MSFQEGPLLCLLVHAQQGWRLRRRGQLLRHPLRRERRVQSRNAKVCQEGLNFINAYMVIIPES